MNKNVEVIEEINDGDFYLRKVSIEDKDFFYQSLLHEEMTIYMSLGPLKSEKHAENLIKSYLNSWDSNSQYNFMIEIRSPNKSKIIGTINLWNISWRHKRAEVGIWVLPKYWNKGYGKKALKLIKFTAYNHLKLHRLEAHITTNNERSINLFKRSDFELEGILKDYLYLNDKFEEVYLFSHINNFNFKK